MERTIPAEKGAHRGFAAALAVLIAFGAFTKGAHDIWAATAVYLAVLLLSLILITTVSVGKESSPIHLPLASAASALVVTLFLSFYQSINPGESYLALMDWLASLLIFYLALQVFRRPGNFHLLLALLLPALMIECGFVVRQWIEAMHMERYQEPYGTFVNGNAAVAFLLLWIPALVYHGTNRQLKTTARWFFLAGSAAALLSVALIGSAWSAVCLLGGCALYVGWARIKLLSQLHPIGVRIFFTLIGAALAFLLWYKLALIYGWCGVRPRRLVTSRISWWATALRMWEDHPWLGVGPGNFPSAYLAYKAGPGQNTLYAHGALFQILAETGLLGLASCGLFFSRWFSQARSHFTGEKRPIAVGLGMFLLFSSMHVSLEYLSNLAACGLLLGVLLADVETPSRFKPSRAFVLVLWAAGAAAVPFLLSPFLASRFFVDGQSYLVDRKWDLAEKSFNSANQLDPRAWEPYAGLARVEAARENFSRAAEFQKQAVARNKLNAALRQELDDYERLLR